MRINDENYKDLMLSWVDGELKGPELEAMNQFLRDHPEKKKELDALGMTVLPAEEMAYPDRQSLYRRRSPKLLRPMLLRMLLRVLLPAAAACLILFLLIHRSPFPHAVAPVATVQPASVKAVHAPTVFSQTRGPVSLAVPPVHDNPHRKDVRHVERKVFEGSVPAAIAVSPAAGQQKIVAQKAGAPEKLVPLEHSPVRQMPSPAIGVTVPLQLPERSPSIASGTGADELSPVPPHEKNVLASVGEARQEMDRTITDKIVEIQYQVSHPFGLLRGREIRIGKVSLAFNK